MVNREEERIRRERAKEGEEEGSTVSTDTATAD